MPPLQGQWYEALKPEFGKEYYRKLFTTIGQEYKTYKVFPAPDDIFNAFHFTPLDRVKVVILGQDPYHNDGQAHGLCFSVKPEVEVPPSLVNIYQELHDDCGCYIPNNGYLEKWAKQGVLMLNTVLTVRAHQANSHKGIGWEEFTDAAIRILNKVDRPMVFLLWGRPAQMKKSMLHNPKHFDSGGTASESVVCVPWVFSAVSISARPMHFWRKTDLRRSTGRLKMCDLAGTGQKHHYGLCIYLARNRI